MSSNNNIAKSNDTAEVEWDEAKLLSALDHLQNMHIQLRNLRLAMSRVVQPLLSKQSSPENLYSQFSHIATTTTKDVQDFAKLIEGDRSQEILKKTKESRAEKPERMKGWMAIEHPDWLEIKTEEATLDAVAQFGTAPAEVGKP